MDRSPHPQTAAPIARATKLRVRRAKGLIECDFGDHEALARALDGHDFDRIVHLGAQPGVRYSLENPRAYAHSNISGHLNMLELGRERGVDHLVYASSSSVYGGNTKLPFSAADRVDSPVSLYAATKKATEAMAHSYAHLWNLPTTMFRFFTVYGPWGRPDMALFKFTRGILNDEPIDIYNQGEMYRDFIFVIKRTATIEIVTLFIQLFRVHRPVSGIRLNHVKMCEQ